MALRPHSVVHSVSFDTRTRKPNGVRVIDAKTRATTEFRAKAIFLCASAMESVRILTQLFHSGISQRIGEFERVRYHPRRQR
jgi:hypothetical protein